MNAQMLPRTRRIRQDEGADVGCSLLLIEDHVIMRPSLNIDIAQYRGNAVLFPVKKINILRAGSNDGRRRDIRAGNGHQCRETGGDRENRAISDGRWRRLARIQGSWRE